MLTRDRGPFRILLEGNDDPQGRNMYFEVRYGSIRNDDETGLTYDEHTRIVWVKDSRIAYNHAIKVHGKNLLNIVNLETGRMVVGGK